LRLICPVAPMYLGNLCNLRPRLQGKRVYVILLPSKPLYGLLIFQKMATKKAENKAGGAFSVVMTGGKQYRVRVGDTLKVEKIKGDFKVGDKIVFDAVLLTDDGSTTKVGAPHVSGAKVEAKLEEIGRNAKVVVVHYKPKSKYYKKAGHRQPFFKVGITAIK